MRLGRMALIARPEDGVAEHSILLHMIPAHRVSHGCFTHATLPESRLFSTAC